jgi:excisionase family DNA binding protein
MTEQKFISVKETAVLLGVKPLTVYRWVESGKLQAIKIGGTIRVNEANITSKGVPIGQGYI